jgi:hypothetical protein
LKQKSKSYDWQNDPQNFKVDDHIPKERCFKCGYRFIGFDSAAFCVICETKMTPDLNEKIYVVIEKPPDKQTPGKGEWITRREFISKRIRVPENIDNINEYAKKMSEFNQVAGSTKEASFTRASDLN